ncbi:peptidoglycan D,D-transpeptidase FtsI family protein [Microvirga lotononidis]|uniref:Cell division protein FtsI/penicillin-binding protein 2 n=1 Tax=Microvirga lotononidis TaxID=864069 RepID=I4YZL7_9HYPH|nr:penicillin-binding protein 2 [Microvirga lotononidis]EIM29409.1 cell division protein FtsI/penicillin-binding protein 2 [Microvirga lotononidis]WQO27270.1 penicillin-binding protein 2 [Microvirga lotononidis]
MAGSPFRLAIDRAPGRIRLATYGFTALFSMIAVQLVTLGLEPYEPRAVSPNPIAQVRPEIIDRNGIVLAKDLDLFSVYAEPRRIIDIDEAVEGLTEVFNDIDPGELRRKLMSGSGFAWIRRSIAPSVADRVWSLGLAGIHLRREPTRVYPNGAAAAHVLGAVDIDNRGVAGIETWIDATSSAHEPESTKAMGDVTSPSVRLSIDLRIQHIYAEHLRSALRTYDAIGAAGLVLDVTNGEIIALVSLPDFDPNDPGLALHPDRINRMQVGRYEMGSIYKALTTALALDTGLFTLDSTFDASRPLSIGGASIDDFRGKRRVLTLPESFIYSSNIAMGQMALAIGAPRIQSFLKVLGQYDRIKTELSESSTPIVPSRWSNVTTATVAFGHGIAVTPLQGAMALAALVNGGNVITPTFLAERGLGERLRAQGVVKPETAAILRDLMRLNVEAGSARRAALDPIRIGGKTGTSEKVVGGVYSKEKVMTFFVGVAPIDSPRYLFLTILDEPSGLPETFGFRTSGWNAVPVTRRVMGEALPLLGIPSWTTLAN